MGSRAKLAILAALYTDLGLACCLYLVLYLDILKPSGHSGRLSMTNSYCGFVLARNLKFAFECCLDLLLAATDFLHIGLLGLFETNTICN